MDRRTFLLGSLGAAAASALPARVIGAALAPAEAVAAPLTYGEVGTRFATYATANMLRHAEPLLVLSKMGMSKAIPRPGPASTIRFRRPPPFKVAE